VVYALFSLFLIHQYNNYHRSYFVNLVHTTQGVISERLANIDNYLSLKQENERLIQENLQYRNQLKKNWNKQDFEQITINDTIYEQRYKYIEAGVINNSIDKNHNYITLDKGERHGIKPDMAVISEKGIVGITKTTSGNYSTVISLLNLNFRVSGKFKKNEYFGPVTWNGRNPDIMLLNEILHHVPVQKGDTIVTSGFSNIFPAGIMIGVVDKYEIKGNFYKIEIDISANLRNISQVYVVENLYKNEIEQLQQESGNE
jgi:rod shape-determining protein MreC